MQQRYAYTNIPTEIVRTVVAISETNSFSRAGEKLGLSQPAISAQMRRLQALVGGAIFERHAGVTAFTARGKVVLEYACKLLEANDQMLALGSSPTETRVRLGISSLIVEPFLQAWRNKPNTTPISIISDLSTEVTKALSDGYVDVACLLDPARDIGSLVFEWREDLVWLRSRDFVLSPGAPIPLIGWPGTPLEEVVVEALKNAELRFQFVFTSTDGQARNAAVTAGLGLMALPARSVPAQLVKANEYYLPALGKVRFGVCVRRGLNGNMISSVVETLQTLSAR